MRINGTTYEPIRPDRGTPLPAGGDARGGEGTPSGAAPSTPSRSDSVQFSDIGRRLSASQADSMDPERVQQLRAKVMEGAYNSLDMVEQVARRVLSSGDV